MTQPPTDPQLNARMTDVVEACADALLSASALSIYPNHEVHDVVEVAVAAIKHVIERTLREWAKPR